MKNNYLIIGAGIIGLAIARSIRQIEPKAEITILEKETREGFHASGRNSGVLHAGFYYHADSLKAKLTVLGNKALKDYCYLKGLPVNNCGKLVVAQNEFELSQLYELEKRGKANGSNISIINSDQAKEIDPNVKTFKKALFSPDTATIDPRLVCSQLSHDLRQAGVNIQFQTQYLGHRDNMITTNKGEFLANKIINCAGLYADKIAHDFGFGINYTIIPFKGLYLKYTKNKTDVKTNIYPVPNLKNPFLGVHFTKTVHNDIKIGPTAIPAIWRENYDMSSNFKMNEFCSIISDEAKLFLTNAFGFRDLAFEEIKKYNKNYFIGLAQGLVENIDIDGFTEYTDPGIRAQLLDKKKNMLVNDFLVEGNDKSIHVLNAVSPAFTCAFPFADFVVNKFIHQSL